jgi:Cu(I)/Ag(I) efflux system membrane fusion protein
VIATSSPRARQRGRAAAVALAVLVAAMLAAAAGYLAGRHRTQTAPHADTTASAASTAGKVDSKGGVAGERKILYYRNPMGLPDTSPVPKKDSMGMDYIPVYEGEDSGGLSVASGKLQTLGVRVAPVERRALDAVVRASGRIEADERRLSVVSAKFDGYVEKLHVNATGQAVTRGAPLLEAFSPELLAAQREYQVAAQALARMKDATPEARAGMQRLADAALARLRLWDIGPDDIDRLAASGEPRRTLTLRAPAGGIVVERKVAQGQRFMAGETLFALADLSRVWLLADVAEQDLGRIAVGSRATVRLAAYPGETFTGTVSFIYPTLKAETRSAQVRIELANPQGRLKPAMFAQVELAAPASAAQLVVPASAVIDSGTRRVVIIDLGAGRFEPREVKTGAREDQFVAILSGVKEGESVVVAANFLLDAESNLRAALDGLKGGSNAGAEKRPVVHEAVGTLDEVDARGGQLLITHEPVASLNWPTMTMEFVPANPAIASAAKPGEAIRFEFVERKPGEWVVTRMEKRTDLPAAKGTGKGAGK